MHIPAPIMSSLKMAIYLALGAIVSYLMTPGVLEKMGLPVLGIGIALVILKGIMTWLAARVPALQVRR